MLPKFREISLEDVVRLGGNGLIADGDWIESKDQDPTGDVRLIQLADIGDGVFKDVSNRFVTSEKAAQLNCTFLLPGDLLIARMPDPIGRCAIFPDVGQRAITAVDVCIVRPSDGVDRGWLKQTINAAHNRHLINALAGGGTRQRISTSELRGLKLLVPPISEQRRIAEILRTWDEAIEKLEALRTTKERRLQTLREKLTFIESKGEPVRLGEVTEEVTARNGAGRLGREMVMGVSNSRGIVPMREQTIADNIARYKLVPHQAFAYNPMRINVGSIAMNELGQTILVSPDYVVFACLAERLEPDFLDHLRKTKWWSHFINSGGSGSVRQRTYYADLAAMKAPLPSFERQREIADILNTARRDVDTTVCEITALQRQKRGLMQKLLTGEWRLAVEELIDG